MSIVLGTIFTPWLSTIIPVKKSKRKDAKIVKLGFRIADESTWQSRDGGFAEESGKEYEHVSGNLRSVGFGRNPKGDSSFLYFILLWIY